MVAPPNPKKRAPPRRVRTAPTPTGKTARDAHERLDIHEQQIGDLNEAVEGMAEEQSELTRSVTELTKAVATLEICTKAMAETMTTFVSDTQVGREKLTKMIGEVLERKTGSWLLWAGGGALLTARDWVPLVWKAVGHAAQ